MQCHIFLLTLYVRKNTSILSEADIPRSQYCVLSHLRFACSGSRSIYLKFPSTPQSEHFPVSRSVLIYLIISISSEPTSTTHVIQNANMSVPQISSVKNTARLQPSIAVEIRSLPFWDVTQRRFLLSTFRGNLTLPIFKGQAIQEERLNLEDTFGRLSRNVGIRSLKSRKNDTKHHLHFEDLNSFKLY